MDWAYDVELGWELVEYTWLVDDSRLEDGPPVEVLETAEVSLEDCETVVSVQDSVSVPLVEEEETADVSLEDCERVVSVQDSVSVPLLVVTG